MNALLRTWIVASVICSTAHAAEELDLSGRWAFRLDPGDAAEAGRWFAGPLPDRVELPGSLQEQGHGNDVSLDTAWTGSVIDRSYFTAPRYAKYREPGNIKVPFWLQPEKHYVGPAWYQRTVTIPEQWRGRHVTLTLERCHWQTTVWVDGERAGTADSLSTPHVYDLSEHLTPGEHRLTIRVDNRMIVGVGPNSHSVSDHTQSNWNGIVGRIELRATPPVWIDDVQVLPDVASRRVTARIELGNATGRAGRGTLALDPEAVNTDTPHDPPPVSADVEYAAGPRSTVEVTLPLGDGAQPWDEFHPALYRLTVSFQTKPPPGAPPTSTYTDRRSVTFGMRELTTEGTQFVLNGRPLFLRGTLECCIFPLTGYPPTDVESWKRVIRACQAHGLNHMRFHSHCPPEAAFTAADELGFYFQVECSSWANQGAAIGEGRPVDRWLYDEADRILRAYGNHPSFLLLAYGNEPAGPGRGAEYLKKWVTHYREKDPRRLYTSASGWPMIAESRFHVTPAPRIQAWGAGLRSRINARPPETVTDYRSFVEQHDVPIISHEIGQWCVYPNFEEIPKYTGVLKPKNFEIFRDFLETAGMGDQARQFLMASGKLQVLCYKEEIESALRTPGFGGFQLLDLHDFPGQGTALVGPLDPFWDDKPYVSPEEFRRFCNATVPLARMEKRVLTTDETFSARIDVAHFGPEDLAAARLPWKLLDPAGQPVAEGELGPVALPTGKLTSVGEIAAPLADVEAPQKLRLVVGIAGTDFENDWDLWVYPARAAADPPDDVMVARCLDPAALARLSSGGKVLLLPGPKAVKTDVALGFSSIFWNTAWTRGQAPHTLGILCDPAHPALAAFPTEYHSNWHWWDPVHRGAAMVLDDLPDGLCPIVQVVPDWFEPKRLGLVFEARVGGGKLLVSSIDLGEDLDERPVARQMRYSLLRYMAGDRFDPQVQLTPDQVRALFKEPTLLARLGATIRADSQAEGYEAWRAIDGDPATLWHTAWEPEPVGHPHHLILDLKEPVEVAGLVYVPRQDMINGRIARFAVYVSDDAGQWGRPDVAGEWPDGAARREVRFPEPREGRYLKLEALSEVKGQPFASVAEVDLVVGRKR